MIDLYIINDWFTDLQEEKNVFQEEVKSIKRQRSNASLQLENDELLSDLEVLQEENKNLKEMIRALEDANNPKNQDGGSYMNGYRNLQNIEKNNNKLPNKTNFESALLINEQSESTSLWFVTSARRPSERIPGVCLNAILKTENGSTFSYVKHSALIILVAR